MEDFGVSNIVDDDGNDLSGGVMSKNLLTMKRIKFVLWKKHAGVNDGSSFKKLCHYFDPITHVQF